VNVSLTRYQLQDSIATVTMDDGKANVMSVAMLGEINAALDRAEADRAVVVVLRGRPGMFSGGFDLSVFKREPAEQLAMLTAGARLSERLLAFPHPVLAVCTGHAIAMGVFVLLSADVRLGAEGAFRIQANEVQIGMTLPRFALEACRQRLTPTHYNLAAGTALPYTPSEAVAAGFLDALAPPEALDEAAQQHATRLAGLSREAFSATRVRLRAQTLTAMAAAIDADVADWRQRLVGAA